MNVKKRDKEKEKNPSLCEVEKEEWEEVKKKAEERDSLWDKYLRVCAEFDNARKRWEREREEIIKFANFRLLRELITIIDELEVALRMIKEHKDIKELSRGLEMTYNNLVNILEKQGVKSISAQGEKFNPHFHEIVAHRELKEADSPLVLEEIQKGYLWEDKVLRPSKVIVGIKPKQERKQVQEERADLDMRDIPEKGQETS